MASRADQRVLKWFGHVERMGGYRMVSRVLMADVNDGGYGRVLMAGTRETEVSWMDGVKVALATEE